MSVDLLIRGGMVYDGTGAGPVRRDVLVCDGRIDALTTGDADIEARRVIDATGLAVTPGFIDIHTHSDVSVLLDGRAQSKVHQGVTTEVVGNCGFSAFPVSAPSFSDHVDLLAGIGDDPVRPSWHDLAGYADAVHDAGVAVNVAPLVGHGQLRIAAAGMSAQITGDQVRKMRGLLEESLEQGAFGMSTGLTYVPSSYAETAELETLCSTLAGYGALYATHARGDGFSGMREAVALGRATGARVQYSHIALNEPNSWGRGSELLAVLDDARADGVDAACDVYPYDASASALTQYLPAWVQEGGVSALRERLGDASTMQRAEADLAAGWGDGARIPWFWDRVVLARTDAVLDAPEGATIEAAAAGAGMSPARYVLELCREGGNRVQVVLFYRAEADMRTFLRYAHCTLGSDGSAIPYEQHGRRPHPRAFGAHARVLGRYVRGLGDLDLGGAVHKMTGAVADRVGLRDRGRLLLGLAADITVFDPLTVADQATFLDPCRPPVGVHHVIVDGVPVIDAGCQTPARPGRVLRSR
ncbi:N-acyl-D-amino-acid deacylase family protein [Phytoactinopolyspora halotolerans]|uniref:D-aminoacylase n=1 Tax=Phytoactinopolyspora halotolerans TaxID=1981512 RepID=A0A6L9SBA1_9ACTN|nr:D-aminoacylase [Phytoactinopolyspora halotolerans]NEE01894.1 D-aminoacylase [Phytoactinopolyspora halotolerans]